MKKSGFLFISIALCMNAMAQNNKVTSAKMHMDEFASHQDSTELIAARQAIDEAALNDKTKDEPKMHLYRAEVYLTLFNVRLSKIVTNLVANKVPLVKATGQGYEKIDTSLLCASANSFIRVLQINPKDFYAQEAKEPQNLPTCTVNLENKAFREYNGNHFATALALSQKLIIIFNLQSVTDSSYKEIVEMAATSADKSGNSVLAMNYYQKLIDMKFGETMPFNAISAMYMKQKDTAKAWDYIEKGRAAYPNDLQLIISETNYYLTKRDYAKAENNLTLSINKLEQSPEKEKNKNLLASLYSNLGNIYDKKANPKDDKGVDLPKPADYADLIAKAETNYKKGLELTPEDFDLNYVLGALYFNQAVPINKQANDLPLNATAKYDKLIAQAKEFFVKAQPYFEHAYKINPNDASNNNALVQVYTSTNQNEKAEAIQKNK
jgi:tetratricopeptide (TPR) repeat protein